MAWSPLGKGVFGYNGASTGDAIGVLGRTNSTAGYGVYGEATRTTGTTYGVYGKVASTNGYAGYFAGGKSYFEGPVGIGLGLSEYGTAPAGWFKSTVADGLYAETSATGKAALRAVCSGAANGVAIEQNAGTSTDVAALKITTAGNQEALAMDVTVTSSFGKLAQFDLNGADGYVGSAFAVEAETSGIVAEFVGNLASSTAATLYARADGTGEAIVAVANGATGSTTPAIYGKRDAADAIGVGVKGEGGYRGVEGRVAATGNSFYYGLYGYVSGGSGTNRAVYGYASGTGTNYAGYFNGNAHVTGTLSKGGGSFKIDHPLEPTNTGAARCGPRAAALSCPARSDSPTPAWS